MLLRSRMSRFDRRQFRPCSSNLHPQVLPSTDFRRILTLENRESWAFFSPEIPLDVTRLTLGMVDSHVQT